MEINTKQQGFAGPLVFHRKKEKRLFISGE